LEPIQGNIVDNKYCPLNYEKVSERIAVDSTTIPGTQLLIIISCFAVTQA